MIYRIIPLIISWILISAQFHVIGNKSLMIASLAVPMFLLILRRKALLFVQWITYAGIIIWIKAGIDYVNIHMVPGGSYFTILIFFSLVALWTVISGLLLYTDDFRRVYR
ncbi:uncharacterized protein METZ01_LOCUS53591 [marine metagenome]|uniref:Uncharacterized protein n=1 Tax=marine metagenome TaxID=408172 RepID=A0A381SEK0_9ZZZZ